jgi:hypothetical protein
MPVKHTLKIVEIIKLCCAFFTIVKIQIKFKVNLKILNNKKSYKTYQTISTGKYIKRQMKRKATKTFSLFL